MDWVVIRYPCSVMLSLNDFRPFRIFTMLHPLPSTLFHTSNQTLFCILPCSLRAFHAVCFMRFMNPHYAGLNPLLPFPPHVGGPGAPSLVHRAPAPGVPGFGPALPAGAVVRPPPSHWAPGPSGPTGPPLPPKVRLRRQGEEGGQCVEMSGFGEYIYIY